MPNGGDRNWVRACGAIDGFRARYGRWPTHLRMESGYYDDLVHHILTPEGFKRVDAVVKFVIDAAAVMIAEDDAGNRYDYAAEGFSREDPGVRTFNWFGSDVVRRGLD